MRRKTFKRRVNKKSKTIKRKRYLGGAVEKVAFDKTLDSWPQIQSMLEGKDYVIVGFTEDPRLSTLDNIIRSRNTLRFIYRNTLNLVNRYCNESVPGLIDAHGVRRMLGELEDNKLYFQESMIPFLLITKEGFIEAFAFIDGYKPYPPRLRNTIIQTINIECICVGDKKKGYGKIFINTIIDNLKKINKPYPFKISLEPVEGVGKFYENLGFNFVSDDTMVYTVSANTSS